MDQNANLLTASTKASQELAQNLTTDIDKIVANFTIDNFIHLLFTTVLFVLIFVLYRFISRRLQDFIEAKLSTKLEQLRFFGISFWGKFSTGSMVSSLGHITNVIVFFSLLYFYFTYAFGIFPSTADIQKRLLGYLLFLANKTLQSFISYIPNLLSILFICVLTYYAFKLSQFLVRALYSQRLIFPGFKREWIFPTYQIMRFFIVVFALIMIFPYLPGSSSPAFRGISVFVGLLVTLGSSSAISNIISGIVLTYMSPFKEGSRIKVGDVIGTITDMSLLVTRIKTIKNENITVPNSLLLSKEMYNYTSSTESAEKLLLSIKVGLGYGVDRKKAEELLLSSIEGVESVINEPQAFVLILSLDDYAVTYELNFATKNAETILITKSTVQKNILDNFNQAGIEILSPAHIKTH